MLGAIIGDAVGSRFEFNNINSTSFEFLPSSCFLTDDSVMTIAIAEGILNWDRDERKSFDSLAQEAEKAMRRWGKKYPNAGYGKRFSLWLKDETMGPYMSKGNGAAMRISPVASASRTLNECIEMSRAITRVTHNHSDALMGAEATAVQIFLSRSRRYSLSALKEYEEKYYYKIEKNYDELLHSYSTSFTCDGTCPASFTCFYESSDFEDAIRRAVSIGGDSDTIASITGSLAEAYYSIPLSIKERIMTMLDEEEKKIVVSFYSRFTCLR